MPEKGIVQGLIESAIDRFAEPKLEQAWTAETNELVAKIIKQKFGIDLQKKIDDAINVKVGDIESVLSELDDVTKLLKDLVSKGKTTIASKLKKRMEAIDVDLELTDEYKEKLNTAFGKITMKALTDGYGNYASCYTSIVKKKLLEHMDAIDMFGHNAPQKGESTNGG